MAPRITRRSVLYAGAGMVARAQAVNAVANIVDHLLLGVADLDRGIEWVEERTGVKAAFGGIHPGAGTRNALLSLGTGHYLEIIAPDPAQQAFNFQIDIRRLATPRLINFAVTTRGIEATAAMVRKAGYEVFGPQDGSRKTPSGGMLRWRKLGVLNKFGSGGVEPVPFFIEWGSGSRHPSESAPGGGALERLRFEHPDPAALAAALEQLGIAADVARAESARLVATIRTPKGRVELS